MGEHFSVDLNGDLVPVRLRYNAQAKRLILRIDRANGDIKLTLPSHVGRRAAEKFIQKQVDWIVRERAALGPIHHVGHGAVMPYLGKDHQIVFMDDGPRTIHRYDGEICVGGPADMAAKRLENWMRRQAKKTLTERAFVHSEMLGVTFENISIGDMKSRWGSCSSKGGLRFSWRLLMAPYAVMDYVAAHEVAHLVEMNHSAHFWAEVAKCVPDHKSLRRWLKTEGSALFKLQF